MTATRNEKGHTPTKSAAPTTRARDTALVHVRGRDLVTDSLTIAREFGRRHDHVLRTLDSLIADSTIGRPNFEETSYTDEWNRQQRMIELDERGALIAMPFVGGRNSRKGQARLVDAFLALRRELAARTAPDCLSARRDAATSFALLSEMLALSREAEGKTTKAYHYANEARLVNQAFCDAFGPLDRDALTASDLRVLTKLQVRDAALIGSGKTYAERKAMLADYAVTLLP
ncbi:Rha family transcriptional regulator [Burkholderia vietnamiensis]|uniref:Rha family transcriptional regulator n=1 Tax=Burkholderia vietnamiensis TaxID=60552 RepID=UPI001B9FFEAA|nr:Rha family transcriptional regulator [Burkholderia vietnamiensis]MBR8032441.1 Rha family transcriptional regulator [Burkholderia vietnamiensis]